MVVITDTVDMTVYVSNRLATKNEIVKILEGRIESKIKSNCSQIYNFAKAAIEAGRRSGNNISINMKKFIESAMFGRLRKEIEFY
jgi:ribosomal protein S3AE